MLKRVSIQNFKSLKDVTLDLQKVNLLIGPNNSGKTNFLKALEIVTNLSSDLNYFDQSIVFLKKEYVTPSLYFIFDQTLPWESDGFKHYKVSSKSESRFVSDKITLKVSEGLNENINELPLEFPEVPIDKEINILLSNLQFELKNLCIYKPDSNRIIQPAYFSADEIKLKGDCSNLIPFIFYLNTNHKRAYQEIERGLDICVRDVVSFSTPPIKVGSESKLGLKFFGRKDEDYWAEDVSEGVIYFLALLTIINQPNPPKLLLLEEPEKGIHPRRIWEVMKFIFRLAEERDVQIIMTTHNEHVVNAFSSMPESIFVFDKDEETGATSVRNLQKNIIEPSHQKSDELGLDKIDFTSSLGENWLYGLIGGVPADEL